MLSNASIVPNAKDKNKKQVRQFLPSRNLHTNGEDDIERGAGKDGNNTCLMTWLKRSRKCSGDLKLSKIKLMLSYQSSMQL